VLRPGSTAATRSGTARRSRSGRRRTRTTSTRRTWTWGSMAAGPTPRSRRTRARSPAATTWCVLTPWVSKNERVQYVLIRGVGVGVGGCFQCNESVVGIDIATTNIKGRKSSVAGPDAQYFSTALLRITVLLHAFLCVWAKIFCHSIAQVFCNRFDSHHL
jgi:hypothetical protein